MGRLLIQNNKEMMSQIIFNKVCSFPRNRNKANMEGLQNATAKSDDILIGRG
jgi:hypothetical protein